MLELLFIEDNPDAVEDVQDLVDREKDDIQHKTFNFEEAKEKIEDLRPDIIILDILDTGTSSESKPEGLNIFDFIWDKHFCPIVVYSAAPDRLVGENKEHPFVKSIQKGKGSPQKVLTALNELRPHVDALKESKNHIRDSFSSAMRDVAPYAFEVMDDSNQRNDMIKRTGRRRLAAQMDEISRDGTKLARWEQYLHPAIGDDIRLGDILKLEDGANTEPASFRVVLTPSCDLVRSSGRQPKVSHVLAARCRSIKDGLQLTSWKEMGNKKLEERLPSILTQGYFETIIFFPSLKNRIPAMVANLRDLELISVQDISNPDGKFLRVASLDSPFRELVAWAYLQTAGRPGLPDRDISSWAEEIIEAYKDGRQDNKT